MWWAATAYLPHDPVGTLPLSLRSFVSVPNRAVGTPRDAFASRERARIPMSESLRCARAQRAESRWGRHALWYDSSDDRQRRAGASKAVVPLFHVRDQLQPSDDELLQQPQGVRLPVLNQGAPLQQPLLDVRTNCQRVDKLDTAHSVRDGLAVTGRRGWNLPLGKRDAVRLLVRRQRNNILH
jgi:hypothetical protein